MKNSDTIPEGYTRVTDLFAMYKTFDNVFPDVLSNAADRGDKAHHACELYALNMLIEQPSEDVKSYFESFKNWFDTYVSEVIYTETRLNHSKLFLSGQFDFLGKFKGSDDLVLVDYKTPQSHEISWRMQTAAYRYLIREIIGVDVERRISLRINKEGKAPTVKEYIYHDHDERLFLNQLEIYRFFHPVVKV